MFDPRVWTKPFVGVVMAAVPWHIFDKQVGEQEIERVEHCLQIVCILAVMRWMYVERYGDEATKLKYWHRGFWVVIMILVISVVSRALFLGDVTAMDMVCGILITVPFVVGLLWKRQGNGQDAETDTDVQEKKLETETLDVPVGKQADLGQGMQPPMQKDVKQPDEALRQIRKITSRVHDFVQQETRDSSTQEWTST